MWITGRMGLLFTKMGKISKEVSLVPAVGIRILFLDIINLRCQVEISNGSWIYKFGKLQRVFLKTQKRSGMET